ncbi:MAG: hypothetical protein Q8R38_07730 [Candidatus Omnitrophota bacterium]|nr:hypothetical protein [Candidatus Omnitrophota bacterium]
MAEEKKDQTKETPKAETPKQEAPKAEAPAQEAPKAEAPKAEAAGKPAEEKKVEEKKKEKPVNCAVCNKSIKKKRYYYRNGKFFCTKRCWKTTAKKEEQAQTPENPSDAKEQAPSK